jgi:hypothetical protein
MPKSDSIDIVLNRDPGQKFTPHLSAGLFESQTLCLHEVPDINTFQADGQTEVFRELTHEGSVCGALLTQAVVEVGNDQLQVTMISYRGQKMQQSDRVSPPGDSDQYATSGWQHAGL